MAETAIVLQNLSLGHVDIEEFQDAAAKSKDGVYRD
jgi:hypothetical protein